MTLHFKVSLFIALSSKKRTLWLKFCIYESILFEKELFLIEILGFLIVEALEFDLK